MTDNLFKQAPPDRFNKKKSNMNNYSSSKWQYYAPMQTRHSGEVSTTVGLSKPGINYDEK